MSRDIEVRRWWRVVVPTVSGPVFIDRAETREEALRIADREGRDCTVIEFTERGMDREVEYLR